MSPPVPGSSLWTGPREDPRRYRVDLENGTLDHVGDGGEGLVYRALSTSDRSTHQVALKMHTSLAIADFDGINRRARILRSVDHPHVMHLVDVFVGTALVDDDAPTDTDFSVIYTVAEWIPGEPLAVARERVGPVPSMRWVAELARGVASLHTFHEADAPVGLVHRDVKPSNVRITTDGQAVLIDFGIARPNGAEDMTQGAGTYLWQAPEVVGGPGTPGAASDAWGVGAVASWILSGEPPAFEGALPTRRRLEEQARQAGFSDPVGLARHIARLLELHPEKRPEDLGRWADDLDEILAGNRPHRWSSAVVEGLLRHSRLALGALTLIVVLAVSVTTIAVYVGRRNAQNVAQAGELAAESVSILPHDATLGGLLSVEASELASTTETRNAVVDALERPLRAVLGPGHAVTSIAFSPYHGIVATGDTAGHVVLWNAATGTRIGRPLSDGSAITSLTFSPDGTILATGDSDGAVVLRQTATQRRIGAPLSDGSAVSSIAFSPSGTILATGDRRGAVVLRQTATGEEPVAPLSVGGSVNGVAFSPDGSVLVTGDSNWDVRRWSTATWTGIGQPMSDGSPVTSVAVSAKGVIASGDTGTYVVLWSLDSGSAIGRPLADGSPVSTVAFSRDGGTLATGINGGEVILWDTSNLENPLDPTPTVIPASLGNGSPVTSVAFSPDGATVGAADDSGDALLWEVRNSPRSFQAGGVVQSVAFDPRRHLVGAGTNVGTNVLWNIANGHSTRLSIPDTDQVWAVAFSPDGAIFATGDQAGHVRLWDTVSGTEIGSPLRAGSFVYGVAFSPDGKLFADGAAGGDVRIWNTHTRREIGLPLFTGHPVRSVAFNPQGTIIAAGGDAGRVLLWNTKTRRRIGRPLVDGSKINSIAFSPDGSVLATGDDAGNVKLWNIATGTEIGFPIVDHSSVYSVAFSPNGKTLATGDAAGNTVAWDVASNTEIGTSLVDTHAVDSVAFSPDARTLAVGDGAGFILLYPATSLSSSTDMLDRQVCRLVHGNLTRTQWAQYLPHSAYRKVCPASP